MLSEFEPSVYALWVFIAGPVVNVVAETESINCKFSTDASVRLQSVNMFLMYSILYYRERETILVLLHVRVTSIPVIDLLRVD